MTTYRSGYQPFIVGSTLWQFGKHKPREKKHLEKSVMLQNTSQIPFFQSLGDTGWETAFPKPTLYIKYKSVPHPGILGQESNLAGHYPTLVSEHF